MVTKMEQASCSDASDAEPDRKVEAKAEPKPVIVSPKKTGDVAAAKKSSVGSSGKPKQASIMNFFQKK
jgi:hypothetical protein